jgi:hypothetical protein
MEKIASQLAESAATWYAVAMQKTDYLPLRERLYAVPQKMGERIDYLLTQEWTVKEPKDEELKALKVTREEYIEAGKEANAEKKSWLEQNRATIEQKWEALVVDNNGDEDKILSIASTDVAGVVLKRGIASARRNRVKAYHKGWTEAWSDLGSLATFEERLLEAWHREGGKDDDLIE